VLQLSLFGISGQRALSLCLFILDTVAISMLLTPCHLTANHMSDGPRAEVHDTTPPFIPRLVPSLLNLSMQAYYHRDALPIRCLFPKLPTILVDVSVALAVADTQHETP